MIHLLLPLLLALGASVPDTPPEGLMHVAYTGVQPDSPDFPPVGVDASLPNPGSISNYKCVAFDNGCPAATGFINGNGNYIGCSATCSGSCTRCAGSLNAASLCKKSTNDSCSISNTSVDCGKKGTASCGTSAGLGGSPDNNGCYCGTPGSYAGATCSVRICTVNP